MLLLCRFVILLTPCGATMYHITLHKVTPAPTMTTLRDQFMPGAVHGAETDRYINACFSIIIIIIIIIPDYVIVVSQVKFLLVLPGVVHNPHTGDEIDYLLGGGVVQVVAALMSPVAVHPLQSQVAVGSSSVSHVRTSVCLSVAIT